MPQPLTVRSDSYHKLLSVLRTEIRGGLRRIERYVDTQKILTHWNIGCHIAKHLLDDNFKSAFGSNLFGRLAHDLNVSERHLEYCAQFYRLYPRISKNTPLTWTHYMHLIRINNPNKRRRWEERIIRERITSGQFKLFLYEERAKEKGGPLLLKNKLPLERGHLYLYRMVKATDEHGSYDEVVIDCGFDINIDKPPLASAKLTSGQLVESVKEERGYNLKYSQQPREKLYTYKAWVKRVVDGDTLFVNIDVGFGISLNQSLRLRGIDAPEADTLKGLKAKKFVQETLQKVPFIIIKTYGSEKYKRYLVDVFFLPNEPDPFAVARKGMLLNQVLLDNNLAVRWVA